MPCGCNKSLKRGGTVEATPEPTRAGQSESARVVRSGAVYIKQPPKPPRSVVQTPMQIPPQPATAQLPT